MMKLIKDNDRLKEQLAAFEEHMKECFHGKRVLSQGCCKLQPSAECPQNVREAVKKSHIELHNQCLKNQVYLVLANALNNFLSVFYFCSAQDKAFRTN